MTDDVTAAPQGGSPALRAQEFTRDHARNLWARSGLTYADLTKATVSELRKMIDAEMKASRLMDGTYRVGRAQVWNAHVHDAADIRCHAYYFKDRQAVTFERNGFIGFAGWADDTNVQPILRAFIKWISWLKECDEPRGLSASEAPCAEDVI